MGRRLAPDEAALWARVRASVRPIAPARSSAAAPAATIAPPPRPAALAVPPTRIPQPLARTAPRPLADTLDRGWDRRLVSGRIVPDRTVDLHGHTLASAHALLDRALDLALAHGDRVILLVTGKPPRAESERPHARGAIRASVADWLALSRHAPRIAAIRPAHPRHGAAGALYVILRRNRIATNP